VLFSRLSPHPAWARRATVLGIVCLMGMDASLAQDNKGGIFSCVDGRGRRLTSDRPIPECLDREQQELNSSGIVRRIVPPNYTAEERARIAEQRRIEYIEKSRLTEEKRRDRALLIRYPNKGVHDKERSDALGQIDEVIDAVDKRSKALVAQRREIGLELEFYQNDINKAPAWLRRKFEDNADQLQIQQRFLSDQSLEKKRVTARFDEELGKLRQLWGQ
jgi:hypothetical protein